MESFRLAPAACQRRQIRRVLDQSFGGDMISQAITGSNQVVRELLHDGLGQIDQLLERWQNRLTLS
jgi:hypothetical protein